MLGRYGAVTAPGIWHPTTPQSAFTVYALSLAHLCRADFHGLPVGYVSGRGRPSRACTERGNNARHLAAALAVVPLHVYVGRSQTSERRFLLGKSLRAILPFFDPAVADPTGLVRGTTSGNRTGFCHGNGFFRRAGIVRPDFLPTATSFRCRFWYFAAADMHFPYRQLQFFQPANHVPVPAAVLTTRLCKR